MATFRRNYTQKTTRVLDIQSLNQCAFPDCTNTLVEPGTDRSDPVVTAHRCHIHAINPGGPRRIEGLTDEYLNSADNLILLCPYHHSIVDGQPETYTAEILKQWKQEHEAKVMKYKLPPDLVNVLSDLSSRPEFPTKLVDQEIREETDIIRRSRFFAEFDRTDSSLTFAKRLIEGELSSGTDHVRCRALV